MQDLRLTIVQPDIIWKNISENLAKYSSLLSKVKNQTDLILLPEMFQTGFCTNPEDISETMEGETVRWMKRTAGSLKCAIAGSLIIKETRKYFNRLIYIDQFGNLTWYDKRHLFRIAKEEKKFTAGVSRLIVPLNGWNIYFQICYDLRFPVWSRNREEYDIFVNLANWPANRDEVWETLLKARAIENLCYVVGINRIGTDGNNIEHKGNSLIVDPRGSVLTSVPESQEYIVTHTINKELLDDYRKNFPVWKDRDNYEIII